MFLYMFLNIIIIIIISGGFATIAVGVRAVLLLGGKPCMFGSKWYVRKAAIFFMVQRNVTFIRLPARKHSMKINVERLETTTKYSAHKTLDDINGWGRNYIADVTHKIDELFYTPQTVLLAAAGVWNCETSTCHAHTCKEFKITPSGLP